MKLKHKLIKLGGIAGLAISGFVSQGLSLTERDIDRFVRELHTQIHGNDFQAAMDALDVVYYGIRGNINIDWDRFKTILGQYNISFYDEVIDLLRNAYTEHPQEVKEILSLIYRFPAESWTALPEIHRLCHRIGLLNDNLEQD